MPLWWNKKSLESGDFGRYLAGWVPRRCSANVPKQARFSRWQGRCARVQWCRAAYNFLLESKISLRICWAFHLREPCDIGIRISQWNQSCAFIWAVLARIRLTNLPPKLPPKGFGTGQHHAALLCTHGTKSILSLGTQYNKTQQNSTLTHKF